MLPFYKTTLAKWLKDFYPDEIAEFEQEAKEEFGWVKKAAIALGRRGGETKESAVNEMQTIGYMVVDDEKLKVLVRQAKYHRAFKLRKSGQDGTHFDEEEDYLNKNPRLVSKLKSGEVIHL